MGRPVKFTDEQLRGLAESGLSTAEISRNLGVTFSTVKKRAAAIGLEIVPGKTGRRTIPKPEPGTEAELNTGGGTLAGANVEGYLERCPQIPGKDDLSVSPTEAPDLAGAFAALLGLGGP
jgi:hypothetical protein